MFLFIEVEVKFVGKTVTSTDSGPTLYCYKRREQARNESTKYALSSDYHALVEMVYSTEFSVSKFHK